ncbi:hypothetical protein HU200_032608 [Digitaria exilis]|uniref:Aquaporin n=1 Tax=Digitaria exilis TaxID=1010633 RepID=A0A835BMS7_9POAL|nr:hypothetical protein HU200_032608 [Digitaria exilis]
MGLVELCQGIHERHALLLQAVMTCVLTYAVYATAVDHRSHDTIAPLAIGFVLGANILTGSPFDHAAMNPTRVFGLARVCICFRHTLHATCDMSATSHSSMHVSCFCTL